MTRRALIATALTAAAVLALAIAMGAADDMAAQRDIDRHLRAVP